MVRRIPQGCASWFSKGTWRTSSLTALELRLLVRGDEGHGHRHLQTSRRSSRFGAYRVNSTCTYNGSMASVVLDQQMMRHFGGRETRTLRDRKYMGAPPFVSPFSASSKADSLAVSLTLIGVANAPKSQLVCPRIHRMMPGACGKRRLRHCQATSLGKPPPLPLNDPFFREQPSSSGLVSTQAVVWDQLN